MNFAKLQTAQYQANRQFFNGDHWQNGDGWVGPLPQDNEHYQAHLAKLRRVFTPENLFKETVRRHAQGVAGKAPFWSLTVKRALPEGEEITTDEQLLISEATSWLTQWMEKQKVRKVLQSAIRLLLIGDVGDDCQVGLRFFIPNKDGKVSIVTEKEACDVLRIAIVEPHLISETIDDLGKKTLFYRESVSDHESVTTSVKVVKGKTIIQRDDEEISLELGGQSIAYLLRSSKFFDDCTRQLQKQLNKSLTMMSKGQDSAGFLERVITDGRIAPGATFGPGQVNEVHGLRWRDEMGREQRTAPRYQVNQPIDPVTFIKAQSEYRTSFLRSVNQLHALITGDATTSGESRKQALSDYLVSLLETAMEVELAGTWLLNAALAAMSYITGQKGKYNGLRVIFTAQIYMGPVSSSEIKAAIDLLGGGIISREEAMKRVGITDIDSELEQQSRETSNSIEHKRKIAEILRILKDVVGIDGALEYLGIQDLALVKKLKNLV